MKKNLLTNIGTKAFAAGTALTLSLGLLAGCGSSAQAAGDGQSQEGSNNADKVTITNVSYDPTRELYEAYNE